MYMLVRMSQHVANTQDSGSFLSVTFASSLVKVKRNFDKFIVSKVIVSLYMSGSKFFLLKKYALHI